MLTLFDYYNEVYSYRVNNDWCRFGQAMFNVLVDKRPDLSERIRGHVALDPYYALNTSDSRIENFINFIEKNWYNNAKA